MVQCIGFNAISAKTARVLILGSLPGAQSLRHQEYYANRQNGFWRIMDALIGASPELAYKQRLTLLKQHDIALWDVCAAAYRPGSLDADIEPASIVPNDFAAFFKRHKRIELICFNGGHAAKLYRQLVLPHLPEDSAIIPSEQLPSTSPAHATMRFEQKLTRWRKVLGTIVEVR